MNDFDYNQYRKIIFFTGAGMSAESGIPIYRGKGGIWNEYNWEDFACQSAFDLDPEKVLKFHELRRIEALKCLPHQGHHLIRRIEKENPNTYIITQNIDGMHQRADSNNVLELHGSLWRLRCQNESLILEDELAGTYSEKKCQCGYWLRPDIIWFQDMLNDRIVSLANKLINESDLFISIGTSAVVWPAAGFPKLAQASGAFCIEINPEETDLSYIYNETIRMNASEGLNSLLSLGS